MTDGPEDEVKRLNARIKSLLDHIRGVKHELSDQQEHNRKLMMGIEKYLNKTGHDLCHESRRELEALVGYDKTWPMPPENPEDHRRMCDEYRCEMYKAWEAFKSLVEGVETTRQDEGAGLPP